MTMTTRKTQIEMIRIGSLCGIVGQWAVASHYKFTCVFYFYVLKLNTL